jgi:hypothetical protein
MWRLESVNCSPSTGPHLLVKVQEALIYYEGIEVGIIFDGVQCSMTLMLSPPPSRMPRYASEKGL